MRTTEIQIEIHRTNMHIRNIWWNQRFPICNKTCPPMYMVLGKLGSGQSGNCPGPNCPQLKEKNSCRLIWILLGMKVIKNTFPTVICCEIRGNAWLVKRPISSGRLVSKCSPPIPKSLSPYTSLLINGPLQHQGISNTAKDQICIFCVLKLT